ncbi:U3 small nucleolar ribonucleoprotein protein IMP4 isoform X5 [Brassica rapa]|uniref:U3 small nucleolar ribonucleoprotein protein IMP4 isoform X5 n=1 Tax=Brassica campestris TaxID=3711 RepID=UPI00142D57D1|nr:U3 small nucleolar ribonucleoprotein protein IMP4 isoform X5 [Brassica rapa]
MEEMMKTTKAGEELVQAKMRREITKLDDEELWAEFEPLEIDRIESGEIKPKTLITNCGWFHSPQFRERGPLIVKEMLSVFPNSTYIKWKRRWIPNSLKDLIRIAKERECTSLVLVDTNHLGHDEICIVSLLNGAAAYFRIFNLIPREDIPDQATPPTRLDPYVRMARFASQAGLGLSRLNSYPLHALVYTKLCLLPFEIYYLFFIFRLIQSLFPKATHSRTNKPCQKNRAFFQYQDGFVFYRHHWLHSEKAALSEERPKHTRKEVGPRFQLLFKGVKKVSLDTGSLKLICMPPASHYDYPERQLMMPPL